MTSLLGSLLSERNLALEEAEAEMLPVQRSWLAEKRSGLFAEFGRQLGLPDPISPVEPRWPDVEVCRIHLHRLWLELVPVHAERLQNLLGRSIELLKRGEPIPPEHQAEEDHLKDWLGLGIEFNNPWASKPEHQQKLSYLDAIRIQAVHESIDELRNRIIRRKQQQGGTWEEHRQFYEEEVKKPEVLSGHRTVMELCEQEGVSPGGFLNLYREELASDVVRTALAARREVAKKIANSLLKDGFHLHPSEYEKSHRQMAEAWNQGVASTRTIARICDRCLNLMRMQAKDAKRCPGCRGAAKQGRHRSKLKSSNSAQSRSRPSKLG
jgi:hypothetical protein